MMAIIPQEIVPLILQRKNSTEDLWQLRLGNTIFYTGLLIGYLIKFLLFKPIGLVITLSTAGLLYLIL